MRKKHSDSPHALRKLLFGSALISDDPRDVDVLLIYPNSMTPEVAIEARRRMVVELGKLLGRRIHSVLLSESEEAETQFIQKEKCRPIADSDLGRLRCCSQ